MADTHSMTQQKMSESERKFWRAVYVAAFQAVCVKLCDPDAAAEKATEHADKAVEQYRARVLWRNHV